MFNLIYKQTKKKRENSFCMWKSYDAVKLYNVHMQKKMFASVTFVFVYRITLYML